jgi:hypothetical protein
MVGCIGCTGWRSIVVSVLLLAVVGCGGATPGVGGCGSKTAGAPTISDCPATAIAGSSFEISGTNLAGGDTLVTFKDATGKTETVKANFGDDSSIDVTVPTDLAGAVTVMLCGLSCTTTVAAPSA